MYLNVTKRGTHMKKTNKANKIKLLVKPEFNVNPEVTANQYAIRCISITQGIIFMIWIFTMFNVFLIDKTVTTKALVLTLLTYIVGALVCINFDLSKQWMKYFIITWTVVLITCITTFLTYHAIIASVLPIIFTAMYPSNRLRWYTVFCAIISTFITVFVGYFYGICDANMVLLTGKPLSSYITEHNTFALNLINDDLIFSLTLFHVFPRSILYTVLALVSSNISKIITINSDYANSMRDLAEKDQMTGVYTKSKYLSMIDNEYKTEELVGVIFWDINYLKRINDTYGHEYGDKLILTVAQSIRQLDTDNDKTYRVGGDEFVMILSGASEKNVLDKLNKWISATKNAAPIENIPFSVSYGYSFGEGKDIYQIIHNADQMMYNNKRQHHELNKQFLSS